MDEMRNNAPEKDHRLIVSSLMHEIRAPLAGARNLARWLKKNLHDVAGDRVAEQLSSLQENIELLVAITDNLETFLEVGRVDSRRESPFEARDEPDQRVRERKTRQLVQIQDILPRVLAAVRPLTRGAKIDVSCDSEMPSLRVHAKDLDRVLVNLLMNSVKYSKEEDSPRIGIRAYSWANRSGVCIDLSDWGIGIPDGWSEAIFEEGVRAPNARRASVTGIGLGLYVANEIVRHLDGKLALVSQRNPTVFRLTLPFDASHGGEQ